MGKPCALSNAFYELRDFREKGWSKKICRKKILLTFVNHLVKLYG